MNSNLKSKIKNFFTNKIYSRKGGYAILFTIVIISSILALAAGVSNTVFKQIILSSTARDSQVAFYAADTAIECGLYAAEIEGLDTITNPWECGQDLNGDPIELNVNVGMPNFYTIMPPNQFTGPCFYLEVDKTSTAVPPIAIIKARGYNSCSTSDPRQVERGIQVEYDSTPPVPPAIVDATGGNVVVSGDYRIHTFTSSGTFNVLNSANGGTVEVLVIAGGGGGGYQTYGAGGGGGAGGLQYDSAYVVTSSTGYNVTVGSGGSGGASSGQNGTNGGNSSFDSITADGGGGGGQGQGGNGNNGGSGGGGGYSSGGGTVGGTGSQGGNGGDRISTDGGAGGGGSATNGSNSGGGGNRNGGSGSTYSITGTAVTYAGGGGGGGYGSATAGSGGSGGGGRGGQGANSAGNGVDGLGGGGGGGGQNASSGGSGGDGIVIIRYRFK